MTFRLAVRYEPHTKRLGGRRKGGQSHKHKRGAWRVARCVSIFKDDLYTETPYIRDSLLQIVSSSPIHPDSFCDPFKVVKEYIAQRRVVA